MHFMLTVSAVEEGMCWCVVLLLVRAKAVLSKIKTENADEENRCAMVARAIESSPLRTIVENAGGEGSKFYLVFFPKSWFFFGRRKIFG